MEQATEPAGPGEESGGRFIRLIAAERFVRGVILLAAGIYLLGHTGTDLGSLANRVARAIELDPRRPFIRHLVAKLGGLRRHQVEVFGVAGIGYGILEGVEGVGLWLEQRWAEWLTVIATALLVPVELYESVHKPSALKAAGIAVNVAIVIYLYRVVRKKGQRLHVRREHAAGGGAGSGPVSPGSG